MLHLNRGRYRRRRDQLEGIFLCHRIGHPIHTVTVRVARSTLIPLPTLNRERFGATKRITRNMKRASVADSISPSSQSSANAMR